MTVKIPIKFQGAQMSLELNQSDFEKTLKQTVESAGKKIKPLEVSFNKTKFEREVSDTVRSLSKTTLSTNMSLNVDQYEMETTIKTATEEAVTKVKHTKIGFEVDQSKLEESLEVAVNKATDKLETVKIDVTGDAQGSQEALSKAISASVGQVQAAATPAASGGAGAGKGLSEAMAAGAGKAKEMQEQMKATLDLGGGLKSFSKELENIKKAFESLAPEMGTFGINVLDGMQKVSDMSLVIGSGMEIFAQAKIGFAGLSASIQSMGGVMGALTSPIGIAIALITALYLAWQTNFGGIREATASIVESITTIFQTFMSWIKTIWEEDLGSIRTVVTTVWGEIEQIFATVFELIASLFKIFAFAVQGDWEGLWSEVVNLIITYLTAVWDYIKNIGTILIGLGETIWALVKEWLETVLKDFVTSVLGVDEDLYDAGIELLQSLWDGLKSAWESIVKWVEDGIEWLKEKLSFWKKGSDSMSKDSDTDGSHYNGLAYVPFDGYTATLHQGEMVLTQKQADVYRKSGAPGTGDTTVIINSPKALSPAETAREYRRVQRELAFGF